MGSELSVLGYERTMAFLMAKYNIDMPPPNVSGRQCIDDNKSIVSVDTTKETALTQNQPR